MNHRCAGAVLLALAMMPADASAAPNDLRPSLAFTIENDAVSDDDRHYSSGLRLSWTDTPVSAGHWVYGLPFVPPDATARFTYALGQNIYTPDDLRRVIPDPADRPYAGWLYLKLGLTVEAGQTMDQWLVAVGIVGPSALGEELQNAIHPRDALGWDSQLRDELTIQFAYQRHWRALAEMDIGGLSLDVTPHLGAALGTPFIYANAGGLVRLGDNMPVDAGPPGIEPVLGGSSVVQPVDGFGWYVFGGVDARLVGRNLFLDGNTFRDDSPSVEARPFVVDAKLGFVVQYEDVRLSYTHIWRSKEFETQLDTDAFGGVNLAIVF